MIFLWFILIVVLFSALYAAAEIVYISSNPLTISVLARKPYMQNKWCKNLINDPTKYLTTALVGNNLANVSYATFFTLLLDREGILMLVQEQLPWAYSPISYILLKTIVAAMLIFVFGELLPKAFFRTQVNLFFRIGFPIIWCSYIILYPLIWLLHTTSMGITRLFGLVKQTQSITRKNILDAINELYSHSKKEKKKKDGSLTYLKNIMDFTTLRTKDCMIPRPNIVGLPITTSIEDVITCFENHSFSKVPIYKETIDNIVGVVFVRDLYEQHKKLTDIICPVIYVPTTRKAESLFLDFYRSGSSVAIVLDEYGGTAGMVTFEDLVTELVGETPDEHDQVTASIRKINNNNYLVDGATELQEVIDTIPFFRIREEYNIEQIQTIAGYVIHHIGYIPKKNELIRIDDLSFEIKNANPKQILSMAIYNSQSSSI